MKVITLFALIISTQAFAKNVLVGEGAKPGCNPEEWTCDSACQERKAASCGLNLSVSRGAKDVNTTVRRAGAGSGKARGVRNQ